MTQKIRVENKTIIRSTLVLTGVLIAGICYTPAQKPIKPLIASREYVKVYGIGKPLVIQETCRAVRRRQLMDQVVAIRKQIRVKAERIRVDNETTVVAHTQQQKDKWKAMRDAGKLVDCITRVKQMV